MRDRIERELLPFVDRPARYMGGEYGAGRWDGAGDGLRVALLYPDLYEVGMSNLGLKVLRQVAAAVPGVEVDRAFVPWADAEARMRERGIPLYGLDSSLPLAAFDLVGVTLQSELTVTNVLTALDLAGIPLRSEDRGEDHPLVCGGGPNAVNPAATAPFFDMYVMGDGEAAIGEVLTALAGMREREAPRAERLIRLAELEGVYVPAVHGLRPERKISVRRIDSLEDYPEPDGLPVPLIEVSQDHHSVEIMRGCTCGCRFCQAGMYYRPVRNRGVNRIARAARTGVRNGGWGAVTLLSLSSADYPAVGGLMDELLGEFEAAGVGLNFPSMRVDSSTIRLLERMGGGRRSGLTFAVEAGSERLREAIGKKVAEADLLKLAGEAFDAGWTLIKLYFMVGLPTETDEDLDAAARLIETVAKRAAQSGGRRNVNVTVSPFVPKPATPFQWAQMHQPEELRRRINRIRDGVRSRRVKLKVHDPRMSALEGVISRGGVDVAGAILRAWELGARFDGWGELFDWSVWRRAFEETGVTLDEELAARDVEEPLPWSFIDLPADERFLRAQKRQAEAGRNVADCAGGDCLGCGVDEPDVCRLLRELPGRREEPAGPEDVPLARGPLPTVENTPEREIWRLRYARLGLQRFVGHLDNSRNLEFLLRRSGLPVVHSAGFNPRMRLHFSPPLPLGVESEAEYLDFELAPAETDDIRRALDSAADGLEGFRVLELDRLPADTTRRHLVSTIDRCTWRADVPPEVIPGDGSSPVDRAESRRERMLAAGAYIERTDKRGRPKRVELAETVRDMVISDADGAARLEFDLKLQGAHAERPDRFLRALLELDDEALARCRIVKISARVVDSPRAAAES